MRALHVSSNGAIGWIVGYGVGNTATHGFLARPR